MGPCMSALSASAPGPYAMNSPDSLAAVSSKAALDTNGSKPYSRLMQLRGGSHTLAEKFGLAPGQNVFKYIDQAECQVSRDAKPLHGAEVDVRKGELQLWYCQGAPIAAPVACVAEGGGKVQLIAPYVHAVDVYVEVDGVPRTDGHVCFGADAGASKSAAIAAATKKTLYGELWMDRFLTDGPSDGSKPWATIVRSDRWGESDGYVYLPLMANDVDNALMGDDTLTYAHALMAKWAALLKDVGEGKHEFALAIRPRGVVFTDDDGDTMFDAIGGGGSGAETFVKQNLIGQHLSDPDAPGMRATWTMSLGADQASGAGPVRKAQAWSERWPADEVKSCVEMAMRFANQGICGAKAAEMAKGAKCCHAILTDGVAGGGIKRAAHGDGEREYEYFCAWALFKSKDGKPDSLGAQIKFVVKRRTIVDFQEVDEDWRSGGYEGAQKGVESVTALTITNAEIDAAIKRDAKYLK